MRFSGAAIIRLRNGAPRMNLMSSDYRPGQPVEMIDPGEGLRYSSPWPWILATALSLVLWAMFGWSLWRLSH